MVAEGTRLHCPVFCFKDYAAYIVANEFRDRLVEYLYPGNVKDNLPKGLFR